MKELLLYVLLLVLTKNVGSIKIFTVNKNTVTEIPNFTDLVHGNHFKDLRCEGDEPLEWIYSGSGRPSKVKEYTRRTKLDTIQSQLKFDVKENATVYADHTGLYTCQALGNTSKIASVYIYFTSLTSPFIDGLLPTKSLYLPEVLSGGKFIIPCATSQPNTTIVLYQLVDTNKDVHDFRRLNAPYNPKEGFTLTLAENATVSSLAGGYVCKTENYTGEFGITYAVYPPKVVKPTPPENIIYVGTVLNLTCEFNEPVVIKETQSSQPIYDDGDPPLSAEDEIEETTETTPTNYHIANYIDADPIPESFGEFQCLTDRPEKTVLHTWNYLVIGKEADELSGIKYSKKKHEFRCKSKGNEPGLLSFIHCATPSECRINRMCFEKSDTCEGYTSPLKNPNRCKRKRDNEVCTKVRHNGGSGLIRCVADGIDEIKSFDERGLRTVNDQLLVLNMTVDDVEIDEENWRFKLTLLRSPHYFIEGHRWSIAYNNGTDVEEVEALAETETNLSRTKVFAQLKIPKTVNNPQKIICRVPLRDSMEWRTVNVDVATKEISVVEGVKDRSSAEVVDETTSSSGISFANDETDKAATTVSSAPQIEFI